MAHYYTNEPTATHDRKTWDFPLRGQTMTFNTDSNVFSRDTVDYGSRVLIEAYDDTLVPEGAILDVGCGYGPIGLSLGKETGREIHMVDVNERALALAEENGELNQVSNTSFYVSSMYDGVEKQDFAAILSNPPIRAGKDIVHGILVDAYQHLKHNGVLMIVIQKKQGAPTAKKRMEETFGNVVTVTHKKGYYIYMSQKTQ